MSVAHAGRPCSRCKGNSFLSFDEDGDVGYHCIQCGFVERACPLALSRGCTGILAANGCTVCSWGHDAEILGAEEILP